MIWFKMDNKGEDEELLSRQMKRLISEPINFSQWSTLFVFCLLTCWHAFTSVSGKFVEIIFCCAKILGYKMHPKF